MVVWSLPVGYSAPYSFRNYTQLSIPPTLQLKPNLETAEDMRTLGTQGVIKVRNALYKHPKVLEQYIAENPDNLSIEELDMIVGWKHRITGDFYVMRYLKKYAVFMPTEKPYHLFGVLGLYDSIAELLQQEPTPVLIKTTLLPFKGQIVCDGLIEGYNILIGPGIRGELTRLYARIKQREGIIEQLVNEQGLSELGSKKQPKSKPAPDWSSTLAELVATTEKMRKAETPSQTAALSLLRAAAHLAQTSYLESTHLERELKRVRRAVSTLENALYESEWE